MSKWIYLVYSHEHKAGYVGKSGNLRRRFYKHCSDTNSCVKQFCISHNVKARDTFDIYEIIKCDVTGASYYEGKTYELIQHYFPDIHLINKNIPNRSTKQWRINNCEKCRANNKIWRANNIEYDRLRLKKWRQKNPEYHKNYSKEWRQNHPEYHKNYSKDWHKKQKLINK